MAEYILFNTLSVKAQHRYPISCQKEINAGVVLMFDGYPARCADSPYVLLVLTLLAYVITCREAAGSH